jgi:hypothetical protein
MALHRAVDAGVVLGDDNDHNGKDQADKGAVVNLHRGDVTQVAHVLGAGIVESDTRQDGGAEHTLVQRAHDVAAASQSNKEAAMMEAMMEMAPSTSGKLGGHGDFGEQQVADQHGGDRGDRVGLEQVGGHTGAVAHVVAHVVGDGGRVAGIVLGNAGFDLAHQVGAHIGTLGEDTAAQTGEDGDQAAAETEGDQRHDVMGDHVVTGNRGQRQAGNDHTGYGAARKAMARPAAMPFLAASAVLTLASTETRMPM